jgi:hypothetical protein
MILLLQPFYGWKEKEANNRPNNNVIVKIAPENKKDLMLISRPLIEFSLQQ